MKISVKGPEVETSFNIPEPDQYTNMCHITIKKRLLDGTGSPASFNIMLTADQLETLGKIFTARAKQLIGETA